MAKKQQTFNSFQIKPFHKDPDREINFHENTHFHISNSNADTHNPWAIFIIWINEAKDPQVWKFFISKKNELSSI